MNSTDLGAFRYLGLGSYWGHQKFRPMLDAALSLRRAVEPPERGSQSPTARAQPPDSRRPFLLPVATAPITVDPPAGWGVRSSSLCGLFGPAPYLDGASHAAGERLAPPIEHGRKSVPWSTSHPCPNTPKPMSPMTLRAHVARQPGVERWGADGGSGSPPAVLEGVAAARITHCELVALPRRRDAVPSPEAQKRGAGWDVEGMAPRRAFRPSLPRTQTAFPP